MHDHQDEALKAREMGLTREGVKATAERLFDNESRLASFAFQMGYLECLQKLSAEGAKGDLPNIESVFLWLLKETANINSLTLSPELRSAILQNNNERLARALKHFGFTPTTI